MIETQDIRAAPSSPPVANYLGGEPQPEVDLEVSKTVNNSNPNEGEVIAYTITVTNNGPDDTTQARLIDVLPAGVTFGGYTATQGTYTTITNLWTIGTLAHTARATLILTVTVNNYTAGKTITNTATLCADSDPSNNIDEAVITVTGPGLYTDLVITKTVDLTTIDKSELITYTVTVTNNGPSPATGISVTDTLPTGLIFRGYTATQGIYTKATGQWEVGDLANTGTASLIITATVNSCSGGPMIANTAVVTAAIDSNPDNNEATASVTSTVASYCIYFPIIYRNYEPCRFYDFNTQEGDWINYEDSHTKFGYINGEFQMVAKNPLRTHLAWPRGQYENYTITTTVKWAENSAKGKKYGLTFGIADNLSSFYTFMVYPDAQDYEIKYYNGSWNTLYFGHSSAINSGVITNHLWLERLNGTISITVNNTSLTSIRATQISGKRHVGIGVGPYTLYPGNSYADARFDDYQICPMDAVSFTNLDLPIREKETGSSGGRSVPGG